MKILNKKAISVIEYSLLIVIILLAFFLMRNYIQRGIYSNWGKTGQSFAFGRQYDHQKSIECSFDDETNQWYDRNCYEYFLHANNCNGDTTCEESIIKNTLVNECTASSCNELNNGESP